MSHILYNIHRVIVHISLFLELATYVDSFPYLTVEVPIISSVWDYVPHGFLFCRTHGDTIGVGSNWLGSQGVDRVDPSPRDCQIKHVLKINSK